jgi:hypothetical protein
MYTEERLFTYLQHFERDFAQSRATSSTQPKAECSSAGRRPMTFADALARYCARPLVRQLPAYPGLRWDLLDDCAASLRNRQDEAREIANISRETLPLLDEIRDHIEDQGRVNRAIAKVDALRVRLEHLGSCYPLIMQLTQKTELQRFHADRKISASKVDGVERQRRQISRDIDNVKAVLDATAEFTRLMQTATANLEAFRARKHDQHRRAA